MFKFYGAGDWLFIWLRLFFWVGCQWVFKFHIWLYIFQIIGGCVRLWVYFNWANVEMPCYQWFYCVAVICHVSVFVVVAFVFVVFVKVGVLYLFLQLVVFTGCDCLSSRLLLGDLPYDWMILGSLLDLFFAIVSSEGASLMISLVPSVLHLAIARHLLILFAVVRYWKICHAILG